MMQQENQPHKSEQPAAGQAPSHNAAQPATTPTMAQNPNPRANENVRDTPMEDNTTGQSASGVGSEITDGEGG